MNCDDCIYNTYDEDEEEYYCSVDMDEDDYAHLMGCDARGECPFYRYDNEYAIVKHQM